jgi:hypothetical protein
LLQGVEHIDQFAGGLGINHRLSRAGVGVRAENHSGVLPKHAHQILEGGEPLRGIGCLRAGGRFRGFRGSRRSFLRFQLGFALLFFDYLFPQFSLGSKGPAVNYAK